MAVAVLWFRRDLRLDDLPALAAAADAGGRDVAPLFVVDRDELRATGPNRRRFLAESLRDLNEALDGRLTLRVGDPRAVVATFAAEVGAHVVVATADHAPREVARDRAVADALSAVGRRLVTVDSAYAVVPGTVRGAAGARIKVFTPFQRAWERVGWPPPSLNPSVRFVSAACDVGLSDVRASAPGPTPLPRWWSALPLGEAPELPTGGSIAACAALDAFLDGPISAYADDRDRPAARGTSRLSPYLRFGCVHPRTVLARLGDDRGEERMRAELAWREFYADVLWHLPQSVSHAIQPFGEHIRWDADDRARDRFRAWAVGRTGYPLVDAGMRQLLAEGWMHNRVRMVAASFLVKDLHIDWRVGARWFMWHLVDGDVASNQHGWQWVAGTGTDAAPFYRVFNPTTQQQRFDPDGTYIRQYVPEFAAADGSYPAAIVDHAPERREALKRFEDARRASAG